MNKKNNIQKNNRFNFIIKVILIAAILFSFHKKTVSAQVVSNNGAFVSIASGTVIGADTINNNNAATFANAGTVNTYTINNAGIAQGNGIYNIARNFINTGIFSAGTGIVNYNGSVAQNINALNYYDLSVSLNGTRTVTLPASGIVGVSNTFSPAAGSTSYSITGSSIDFNGSAQTIPSFDFENVIFSGGNTKVASGNFNVANALTLGANTTLALSSYSVTLKSTITNTARVAAIPATAFITYGTGKFIVERFISSLNNRAYRLLAAPVSTTASINANWQEGVNNSSPGINIDPSPGYGTQITGSGGAANGFDVTQTNAASLYTFNQATHAWQSITNTANSNTLNYLTGYLLYIRGDRSINLGSQANPLPSVNTTLRASGHLITGAVVYHSLSNAGEVSMITNPYAAPVDWNLIYTGSATTNFENYYTYWDPNIGTRGGYVTVTNGNITSPSSFGAAPYGTKEIQSGQAFFVKTKTGISSPSLTINETHKSINNNIDIFEPTGLQEKFSVTLFFDQNGSRRIADGAVAIYKDTYSKNIGEEDAEELANWDENIAIARAGKILSIEGRPLITGSDTLPLFMSHIKQQAYEFEFNPDFTRQAMVIELVDKFAGTRTLINQGGRTTVNFTVNGNTASSATDRFYVVFGNAPLPVTLTNVNAYAKNSGVQVEWNTEIEINMDKYEVERSATGQQFAKIGSAQSQGNSNVAVHYNWFDALPLEGTNFYRIKSISLSGEIKYTAVVKVVIAKKSPAINIYPNPITGSIINVSFVNLQKGNYDVRIINTAGQNVYEGIIKYPGDNSWQAITISNNIPSGVYELELSGNDVRMTKKIFKN